jgi:UDP-N-acetylmuramate-alanine ligase
MMPGSLSRTIDACSPAVSLSSRQRFLLLGAKGAGMSALSDILRNLGHLVTGSDQNDLKPTPPDATGHRLKVAQDCISTIAGTVRPVMTMVPWSVDALPVDATDICVFTPALSSTHPLLTAVVAAGVRAISLHQCLAGNSRQDNDVGDAELDSAAQQS